jgi:hypothetical protein
MQALHLQLPTPNRVFQTTVDMTLLLLLDCLLGHTRVPPLAVSGGGGAAVACDLVLLAA